MYDASCFDEILVNAAWNGPFVDTTPREPFVSPPPRFIAKNGATTWSQLLHNILREKSRHPRFRKVLGQVSILGVPCPGCVDDVHLRGVCHASLVCRNMGTMFGAMFAAIEPVPVLAGMGEIGADCRPITFSSVSRASSKTDTVFLLFTPFCKADFEDEAIHAGALVSMKYISDYDGRYSHEDDFVGIVVYEMIDSTWLGLSRCSYFSGLLNVATGGADKFWVGFDGRSVFLFDDSLVINDGFLGEM